MTDMSTVDRRVIRTHKLLGAALVDLAIEKNYEDVTIQDVTDRADVGYRTFFRHFASKDELLLSVAQATINELEPMVGFPRPEIAVHESAEKLAERSRILFQFVQDRERIFRVLLLERGSRSFLQPVIEHARQKARDQFDISAETLPLTLDMMVTHVVTATLSMVRWWLENDMPYTPAEMGEYMATIIMLPNSQNMINLMHKVQNQ